MTFGKISKQITNKLKMRNEIIKKSLVAVFIIGLMAVLKFLFDLPYLAIIILLILILLGGLMRVMIFGFFNPPSWLYRKRFILSGICNGIFIGIMLFGMEAIENNTFIGGDLLKFALIGSIVGAISNSSMYFSKPQKLKRSKGEFLHEMQQIKELAQLKKRDGKRINGQLVLTNENLIFLENKNQEKILEQDIREIKPNINTLKFLGIPNGFKIANGEILLKVPFPYYWQKIIEKRKRLQTAT